MSRLARLFALFLSFAGLLLGATDANALACTSAATGNWGVAGTWTSAGNCNRVPTVADTVTIAAGHTVTVNVATANVLSVTVNTGAILTQNSALNSAGVLSVVGTLNSTNTMAIGGATTVAGALNITATTGTRTFTGLVTVNAGGVWNNSINEPVTFRGGITNNGTFTAGTGTQTFNLTQAIGGASPINFGGIVAVVGAVTVTNNNTNIVTIAGNLTGSAVGSTWVNAANSTLNYGGAAAPMGTRVFTASAVPNTVNYTRAGAQTAKVTTYNNLTLSGSGIKTFATTPTVNGILSMEGTATVVVTGAGVMTYGAAATLQYNTATARTVTAEEWGTPFTAAGGIIIANTGAITLNAAKVMNASVPLTINSGATLANGAFALSVAGDFTQNGTFTAGTGVFTLNGGAAVQTISGTGPLGFANLTVNNTGGITLARNVTVTSAIIGAVTLTSTCPADYTLTSNGGFTVAHSCNQPVVTSIALFDPNPTVLASVRWTVTFNQSVTGVTSSNFALVNSGLGGAPAITSVTGVGTTWTVTASTGTGTGTLGLNMSNVTGISPAVITPMPFTGQVVYSVRPPAPVTYFHDTTLGVNIGFDGLTNVTGANQVIPPIITASLNPVSTCPVTSARSASHPVGLYTHSRWYLNANYAVATNIGANPNGSASLRGVAVTDTVVVSLYDYDPVTGVKVLIGSSAPITLTGGGTTTTYLYTITSALYTVPAGHRLMLEYNFNQPVTTNNARVYCGVASYIAVTESAATVAPDHLVIQSTGSGLTCAANTLTIVACQDVACATPFTGGVSGTLTATGAGMTVNWDGTTGGATGAGFAIPSGSSSVTKNVQVATAGSVVFGITSPAPVPTNATACNFGAPACTFTADTAGFVFSDTTIGSAYTIPAQVSGIATPTLYLRALQAATNNPAVCTPAIIGQTIDVTMGYACNNPATCQTGSLATITNTATSTATAIAPGGTSVSLNFNADGSAPITARYDDVGEITLNASKTVTPFGGGTAVTLNGSSNPFVVKPDHFDLSGIQQTAAPNLANPAAADAAGNKFVMAGEPFTVTVTAKNALGNTTKNYGQESTAESVKLTSALVAGLGLTDNPVVSGTFGTFTNGVATGTAFTWSEVGIIKLTPSVGDGNYLGAGDVSGTQSGNVGRFSAAKFALSPGGVIANRTDLAGCAVAGCGTFTYMGEQMNALFTLTAQAIDGTLLQNYNWSATPANQFAKLNPLAAVTAGTGGPLDMGAVNSAATRTPFQPCAVVPAHPCLTPAQASVGSFVSGVADITVPFTIYRDNTAAAGPYAVLDIGVAPQDSDGVAMPIAAYDLDTVNVVAGANNHAKVGRTEARYGRMKLSNAHGSELLNLPIAMEAQYWQGQYWSQNHLDDATAIVQNNIKLTTISGPAATISSVVKDAAGRWRIVLGKQAAPGGSSVCVDLDVGATGDMTCVAAMPLSMPYLQTGAAFDKDPASRATFGVYKGNNEFIYLREAY